MTKGIWYSSSFEEDGEVTGGYGKDKLEGDGALDIFSWVTIANQKLCNVRG